MARPTPTNKDDNLNVFGQTRMKEINLMVLGMPKRKTKIDTEDEGPNLAHVNKNADTC
jgi:hypothetical protein